ncbi:MAG: dephospho-CoA kinase [Oleiphilaceae bacterium]|nr:dephospho-CoA kinase [Oleiphilaceae bacterium]
MAKTPSPAIIGLTGGIGSGKSTVARMFGELGVHWVDADVVAREVVASGSSALAAIAGHFGEGVMTAGGELDRAALRAIIFEDAGERAWLEGLLHPIIREELVRQLRPPGYHLPYALLVSPLLLETDQHTVTKRVVVVDVPVEVQVERTVARDDNTKEQVERIIAAQMPREERLSRADDVIRNDGATDDVRRQVTSLHEKYMTMFG